MTMRYFIDKFKSNMIKRLETKTGWGRKEVLEQINFALLDEAADMVDQRQLFAP